MWIRAEGEPASRYRGLKGVLEKLCVYDTID